MRLNVDSSKEEAMPVERLRDAFHENDFSLYCNESEDPIMVALAIVAWRREASASVNGSRCMLYIMIANEEAF